jgi:TetR/AcrR family transcriptional regulator, transcriptional repressor for nem operon
MARHKEFDEAEDLRKAMVLFWRNGYKKTSMQDLVDYLHIHYWGKSISQNNER